MQVLAEAYLRPRRGMARAAASGLSEGRAFGHLLLACGIAFLASVPNALGTAGRLDMADAAQAALSAHLFAFLFVAPLLLYGLAAGLHLVARAFGGRAGYLGARAAVARSALLGAPIALGVTLAGLALGQALPGLSLLSFAGFAYWLWLLAACFGEVEGFAATDRVAVCVAFGICGAGLLSVLLPAGAGTFR